MCFHGTVFIGTYSACILDVCILLAKVHSWIVNDVGKSYCKCFITPLSRWVLSLYLTVSCSVLIPFSHDLSLLCAIVQRYLWRVNCVSASSTRLVVVQSYSRLGSALLSVRTPNAHCSLTFRCVPTICIPAYYCWVAECILRIGLASVLPSILFLAVTSAVLCGCSHLQQYGIP